MSFPARFLRYAAALLLPAAAAVAGDDVVSRPGVLHLNLDSAIRMALAKNYNIQIEQMAPALARAGVTSALGRFDPDFTLSLGRREDTQQERLVGNRRETLGTVTRVDDFGVGLSGLTPLGTSYDVGFGSVNNTGNEHSFADSLQSNLRLGLTQPLLRGFGPDATLSQIRIARNNVQVSEWQLRSRIIDTLRDVEYIYNDLHTAHENLRVALESQALARQTMEDNMKRAAIGVMTPLNITTARAEVAARQEAVILARRNVLDNENYLKQLVTDDIHRMLSIRVEVEPPPAPRLRPNVLAGISDALAIRPDYRQAILELQRRNISLAFQKNQALPQLDLKGSLNLLGFDNGFGSSVSRIGARDATNWTAGAVFSIPLGNREARGNVEAARIEAAQSLVNLQRLEQQIVVDVDNAAGQITTNEERIDSTTEARKLAEESLAAGEERLRAGTGTTFEVLELQKRLTEAQYAELKARTDYAKAVAEFYRQTGTTLRERRVVVGS